MCLLQIIKDKEEKRLKRLQNRQPNERDPEAIPRQCPDTQRAAYQPIAARTKARIFLDCVAEKVLVAACRGVQFTSLVILASIFVFTFMIAFWEGDDGKQPGGAGMQTWCGLFPFYFTDTIGINRIQGSHHPSCSRVEPFVRG